MGGHMTMEKRSKRGGTRPGAGRKKKEATVVVRIPVSLLDQVEQLVERHRAKTAKKGT